jgi:hypothetical protein
LGLSFSLYVEGYDQFLVDRRRLIAQKLRRYYQGL